MCTFLVFSFLQWSVHGECSLFCRDSVQCSAYGFLVCSVFSPKIIQGMMGGRDLGLPWAFLFHIKEKSVLKACRADIYRNVMGEHYQCFVGDSVQCSAHGILACFVGILCSIVPMEILACFVEFCAV